MPPRVPNQVVIALLEAARSVVPAPEAKAWSYGWHKPEYRRSPEAAFDAPSGVVRMSQAGVAAYERAVTDLQRVGSVVQHWSSEEFWSVIVRLVAEVSERPQGLHSALLFERLGQIVSPAPCLVMFPIANVEWEGPPRLLGRSVIGRPGDALDAMVASRLGMAANRVRSSAERYHHNRNEGYGNNAAGATDLGLVMFVTKVAGQGERAFQQATQALEALIDLVVLFATNHSAYAYGSLRGPTNRPGVRGLMLDRRAVQNYLADRGAHELGAEVLVLSPNWLPGRRVHWYSADPMTLERLLDEPDVGEHVVISLTHRGPVADRLRTAARWFADAHWATDEVYAALALGVALDALLGSKSGVPGRVIAERFALLEPDRRRRAERAARCTEIAKLRNAVAHGGTPTDVSDVGVIRGIQKDVRWVAMRMLAFERNFAPESEPAVDAAFAALRWGSVTWEVADDG
jgi:hypothetical protein